jgi:hypothetical protein
MASMTSTGRRHALEWFSGDDGDCLLPSAFPISTMSSPASRILKPFHKCAFRTHIRMMRRCLKQDFTHDAGGDQAEMSTVG